uniref:Phospholipid/glycerol acyltransferase domain-containing protein n=1 Tax=Cryptomonas curvata TaxID=233186 RepID=A0A7S0MEC5_9CRYP
MSPVEFPSPQANFQYSPVAKENSYKKGTQFFFPYLMIQRYPFVLLWAAFGLDLTLSLSGHIFIGKIALVGFLVLYVFHTVSFRQMLSVSWITCAEIYLSEIAVRGTEKLEKIKDGRGIIFAIGPHVNMFVDPFVIMKVVAEATGRHVSFLTAAVTYKNSLFGAMARGLQCVPIVRPEDVEPVGKGSVTVRGVEVFGHEGTRFMEEFGPGAGIVVKARDGLRLVGTVDKVSGDDYLLLETPLRCQAIVGSKSPEVFALSRTLSLAQVTGLLSICCPIIAVVAQGQFLPHQWPLVWSGAFHLGCLLVYTVYWVARDEPWKTKEAAEMKTSSTSSCDFQDVMEISQYSLKQSVDNSETFDQVESLLLQGGTVGVFPEGFTHDGPKIHPFKAGIAKMYFGTMARHQGAELLKISVIPVGLNYASPHEFRRPVLVQFGNPIEFRPDLVSLWMMGSKEEQHYACNTAMQEVMDGLVPCIHQPLDTASQDMFEMLHHLLVNDSECKFNDEDIASKIQDLVQQSRSCNPDPLIAGVMERCSSYCAMLGKHLVQNEQVEELIVFGAPYLVFVTLIRIHALVLLLPYWTAVAPAALFISIYSDLKAKKAGKMCVKGSWKGIMGPIIFPVLHGECTLVMWATFGQFIGVLWFILAPIICMCAVFAAEGSRGVTQAVKSALILLIQKNTRQSLRKLRETLQFDSVTLKGLHPGTTLPVSVMGNSSI